MDKGLPQSAYQAWRTCLEMLEDRGYNVSPLLLQTSEEDFTQNYTDRQQMALHMIHREIHGKQIRVIFIDRTVFADGHIRTSNIATLLGWLGDRRGTQGVFVLAHDVEMTCPATKVFDEVNVDQPGLVQWFTEAELGVNVVRIQRRARGICIRLDLEPPPALKGAALQRIYVYDRVARYFNALVGDVLSITRNSETGGRATSYRRCVSSPDRNDIKLFV